MAIGGRILQRRPQLRTDNSENAIMQIIQQMMAGRQQEQAQQGQQDAQSQNLILEMILSGKLDPAAMAELVPQVTDPTQRGAAESWMSNQGRQADTLAAKQAAEAEQQATGMQRDATLMRGQLPMDQQAQGTTLPGTQAAMDVLGVGGAPTPMAPPVDRGEAFNEYVRTHPDMPEAKLRMIQEGMFSSDDETKEAIDIGTKRVRTAAEIKDDDMARKQYALALANHNRQARLDTEESRADDLREAQGLMTPEQLTVYNAMMKEMRSASGAYWKARDAEINVQGALESIPTMKGIQGYVNLVSLLKSLDDSVVREGEVRTAKDSLGTKEALLGWIEKGVNGGYTDEFKRQLEDVAKQIQRNNQKKRASQYKMYLVQAKENGFEDRLEAGIKEVDSYLKQQFPSTLDDEKDKINIGGMSDYGNARHPGAVLPGGGS